MPHQPLFLAELMKNREVWFADLCRSPKLQPLFDCSAVPAYGRCHVKGSLCEPSSGPVLTEPAVPLESSSLARFGCDGRVLLILGPEDAVGCLQRGGHPALQRILPMHCCLLPSGAVAALFIPSCLQKQHTFFSYLIQCLEIRLLHPKSIVSVMGY